jgi:hypothetical protein
MLRFWFFVQNHSEEATGLSTGFEGLLTRARAGVNRGVACLANMLLL